jgi:hypothetical protein
MTRKKGRREKEHLHACQHQIIIGIQGRKEVKTKEDTITELVKKQSHGTNKKNM